MLLFLVITFFWISIVALLYIEKVQYETPLTPLFILSVPMLIVVTFAYLIGYLYDLENLSPTLLLMILSNLFVFKLFGFMGNYYGIKIFRNKNSCSNLNNNSTRKIDKFMILISVPIVLILYYKYYITAISLSNISYIVQSEFQQQYTEGIYFYLRLICIINVVYFLGTYKQEQKWRIVFAVLLITPLILSLVKGIMIIPVIAGIILNQMRNKYELSFLKMSLAIVIGILLFYLTYLVEICMWDISKVTDIRTYQFILSKLSVYLISGIQSFNVNINENIQFLSYATENPVFAPIINLLAKFGIVDRISNVPNNWTSIGYFPYLGNVYVNTNTFIGTLVLYCGYFASIIITAIWGTVSYFMFARAIHSDNIIYRLIYALVAGGLAMGWFEYYFLHPFWFYMLFYLELLAITARRVAKSNKIVNKIFIHGLLNEANPRKTRAFL